MKLLNKSCVYCKKEHFKILLTKNKSETLDTCKTAIFDMETGIYFENPFVKNEIMRKISFYCVICPLEQNRRFQTQESLSSHYEKFHKLAFCEKCLEFKPDLLCD